LTDGACQKLRVAMIKFRTLLKPEEKTLHEAPQTGGVRINPLALNSRGVWLGIALSMVQGAVIITVWHVLIMPP